MEFICHLIVHIVERGGKMKDAGNKPAVSVVIPTHKRIAALCEAVEALARQTYTNFEIVIVNDGGPSVKEVQELYPEQTIQLIELEKNVQGPEARNIGVRHAQGDLIMLCDDDDLLTPHHIETMVHHLGGNGMVYADAEIFDYEEREHTRHPISRRLFSYEYQPNYMREFSTYISSGCLYRKELHQVIGYFDPEVHHYWDWDFALRVQEKFELARVPVASVLYAFSEQGGNASAEMTQMRQHYLDLLSAKHQLGTLPTKNFFMLLEEPRMKQREALSKRVWDGQPIVSRYAERHRQTMNRS